jgi:hypothetical protein
MADGADKEKITATGRSLRADAGADSTPCLRFSSSEELGKDRGGASHHVNSRNPDTSRIIARDEIQLKIHNTGAAV